MAGRCWQWRSTCHSKKANQVAAIPGVLVHQDGDDEKTFVFPVTLFPEIAAIVEPKRTEALIGAIVLEALDLLVDCSREQLIPRDPSGPLYEIE